MRAATPGSHTSRQMQRSTCCGMLLTACRSAVLCLSLSRRVEGVLAVTRAIGDRRLKKYVSAVPEIKTRVLQPGGECMGMRMCMDVSGDVFACLLCHVMCPVVRDISANAEAAEDVGCVGRDARVCFRCADDYLILASDGIWDVLSSQTACDLISTAKDPKEAAQILTDTAYHSHSMDNITALVIDLRSYR